MIRAYLLFFIILLSLSGHCQKHASVWYFGENAGLEFGEEIIPVTNSSFIAEAGCAVICDTAGELLFYTNGITVWNKNHVMMLNGDSLNGNPRLNQNSLIIPFPGSRSKYYLFTISDQDSLNGFNYSIINMNLDHGNGGVEEKNHLISTGVLEKIGGVMHCNGTDYWVVVHNRTNGFLSYLIDNNGLSDDSVFSSVGTIPKADIGYMKISPRGDAIIFPTNTDDIIAELFDFDNRTGVVYNQRVIRKEVDDTYCFGAEFSPSGDKFYISTRGKNYSIWQYETNSEFVSGTGIQIASGNNFAMQLAPDGKIYIASENRHYLNCINQPEENGAECHYSAKSVILENSKSLMGLPGFVQSWFYKPNLSVSNICHGDLTVFSFPGFHAFDSCILRISNPFGEIACGTKQLPYSFKFTDTGSYSCILKYFNCGSMKEYEKTFLIIPRPSSSAYEAVLFTGIPCLTLDGGEGMDAYQWNTGGDERFETICQTGNYYVDKELKGCVSRDSIFVIEGLYSPLFPNAFTPNGDGKNDCFGLINPIDAENFKLYIFSRSGHIVAESNDPYYCWDGNYNNSPCPVGTYVWDVVFDEFVDGIKKQVYKRGTITLIR